MFGFLFICLILPFIVGFSITTFYSGPEWLTVSYSASIILIVLFSSIVGEINANKKELIYLLTKNIKRQDFLWAKILSSWTIAICFSILLYLFFAFVHIYIINHNDDESLFHKDITWYFVLTNFILFGIFGSCSVIVVWHIRYGISIIVITLSASVFTFLFPMIWGTDSTINDKDYHRMWYTGWGPLSVFLPLTFILLVFWPIVFSKKRINI